MNDDGPKAAADLASLPEDERISLIAQVVKETGHTAGVCVDDEPGKPERYRKKLEALGVKVVGMAKGPVAGVVTLRVESVKQ